MSDRKLNLEQQIALCQQIARLTRAKLPLIDHLTSDDFQTPSGLKQAGQKVREDLALGKSLTDALVRDDSVDSRILAACLEAGQTAKCLEEALESWAGMHIAWRRANLALRAALVYPLLLILIACLAVGWTAWHATPEIRMAYAQYDAQPPVWLQAIFWLRDHYLVALSISALFVLAPVGVWIWKRWKRDPLGVPEHPSHRLRLQALASRLAALQLSAGRPLSVVVSNCLSAMGVPKQRSEKAFRELRLHRPLDPMPMETTMILASLHCGIVSQKAAVVHCQEISRRLQEKADLFDQQQCRWLPMLLALSVGAATVFAYAILVYLPWVGLMSKIVETHLRNGIP